MNLDQTYLQALVAYQKEAYQLNPPDWGQIGELRFGKLQEDPTRYPAVVLLHYGDREDPGWLHEMIVDQVRAGGGASHRIWGGYRELGSTASHWWHRFTEDVICYQLNTTLAREEAMARGMELAAWLALRINEATPAVLGLTTIEGQTLQEGLVMGIRAREGGGPDNYIWKITLRIATVVYHAS